MQKTSLPLKMKDYQGGAGPSLKQSIHNTQVLATHLKIWGIAYREDYAYAKELWDGKELNLEIFHPKNPGEIIHVGYDRWGFVVEHTFKCKGFHNIDQSTLEDTLSAINRWYTN